MTDEKCSEIKFYSEIANAPKPVGPYSAVVEAGGMVFLSGQVGIDPATGSLVTGGVDSQAEQVLRNLKAVLDGVGSGFDRVIKSTIFLTDLANFQIVNGIYGKALGEQRPARSTIQVAGLPLGALVEIEMIAMKK